MRTMSRIVLLEFPDKDDAERFVKDTADNGGVFTTSPPNASLEYSFLDARVVAVVARPTVWCKCDVIVESKYQRRRRVAKQESGWMRGGTFGWHICAHCKKPSKAVVLHFITNMLAGANDLLPAILGHGKAVTPSQRWENEGGIPNPYADEHPTVPSAQAVHARRLRRSDEDREASTFS